MSLPGAGPRAARRPPSRRRRVVDIAERVLFSLIWFAIAVAISLGAAGVVAALDHEPGTPARPELTWAADSRVAPQLAGATAELREISELVDDLGIRGRGALAALTVRDFDILNDAITSGTALVAEIRNRSTALEAQLADLDGFDAEAALRLSPTTRAEHARLVEGAAVTRGLDVSWARLTQGGVAAASLAELLAEHDARVIAAIEAGRAAEYDEAFTEIDAATAALDSAKRLRDQLAAQLVDVATLDEWMRRNRDYDVALRALYEATAEARDRVTPALRRALQDEADARAELPRSTNGLSIVMTDIARGGLNQAVIAIESARGRLAAALEGPMPAP